jgi:hypothetical protein
MAENVHVINLVRVAEIAKLELADVALLDVALRKLEVADALRNKFKFFYFAVLLLFYFLISFK